MKHLIVYAHPNKDSFNHAILQTMINTLTDLGAVVNIRDLYELKFNPCYSIKDIEAAKTGDYPKDVLTEQNYIQEADKITFISPVWWSYLPAVLKGYFDRVFTSGFAFNILENGSQGLLGKKHFGMFNTFGGSRENMKLFGLDKGIEAVIDTGIFKMCESPLCFHRCFYEVEKAGFEKRTQMLEDVKKEVKKFVLDSDLCPFF
ncbi:MAG: NAD(P)H-dependent oxidoreductase [Bacteroidales bacterium]|nr:NAD(P)H-dependent oxidoreductase [Bacteroidales bacterium]